MITPEFKPWPKIPRPKGNMITISEKIDGTNACIIIQDGVITGIQSRNRMIECGDDNMGFAQFVRENEKTLSTLGDGYHYGEWAGPGIQKNPHNLKEKTFFLFNTFQPQESLPEKVRVVDVLYRGPYSEYAINKAYSDLWDKAAKEKYQPEGIIVFSHATRSYVKHTYANQDGKWVNS